MAFPEDVFKSGYATTGIAVGAAALILPTLFPALRAPVSSLLRTGIMLFVEAEFEVEGVAVDLLVDACIDALCSALERPGTEAERRQQAEAVVENFKRRARRGARRLGRSDKDQARRYRRHVAALKQAMSREAQRWPDDQRAAMERLSQTPVEDW
jgi:hypothetical protein